jgi:hypothetical protein
MHLQINPADAEDPSLIGTEVGDLSLGDAITRGIRRHHRRPRTRGTAWRNRSLKSEPQRWLTCRSIAVGPDTFRQVPSCLAKDALGESSAVAFDRTAYAAYSPRRAIARVTRL